MTSVDLTTTRTASPFFQFPQFFRAVASDDALYQVLAHPYDDDVRH